jgi:hypothetical protein
MKIEASDMLLFLACLACGAAKEDAGALHQTRVQDIVSACPKVRGDRDPHVWDCLSDLYFTGKTSTGVSCIVSIDENRFMFDDGEPQDYLIGPSSSSSFQHTVDGMGQRLVWLLSDDPQGAFDNLAGYSFKLEAEFGSGGSIRAEVTVHSHKGRDEVRTCTATL